MPGAGAPPSQPRSDPATRLELCNLLNFRLMLGDHDCTSVAGPCRACRRHCWWLSGCPQGVGGGGVGGGGAHRGGSGGGPGRSRWEREAGGGEGVRGDQGLRGMELARPQAGRGRRRCSLGGTWPGTYRCPRALGRCTQRRELPGLVRSCALRPRARPSARPALSCSSSPPGTHSPAPA